MRFTPPAPITPPLHIRLRWGARVRANYTNTWRERAGMALRRLAYRLDGRPSLACSITSTPQLDGQDVHTIFQAGVNAMGAAASSLAHARAIEQAMHEHYAWLYAAEPVRSAEK